MKLSTLPLHKAIVDRLEAQTAYKIFDDHPENEAYPYVTMGSITAMPWCDKFEDGLEIFPTLHIWSQYRGRKEADEMADAILQALTGSSLNLSPNFRVSFDSLDFYDLIVDEAGFTSAGASSGGIIRHGILKMKYLVEEI